MVYIDPFTGSLVFQAITAGLISILLVWKRAVRAIVGLASSLIRLFRGR